MALSAAVNGGGPAVAAQPVVDLETGAVPGYEALARFDPSLGAPPDRWFAMAGRLGFGPALEQCAITAALERRRLLPEGCWLAINVTPGLLGAPEVLAALDCDLGGVVLELTEHQSIDDVPAALAAAEAARDHGARIAIDDVGAGYAGLQRLLALRPEVIKADRALVEGLDTDPAKVAMLELLANLADSMGSLLLAEGVETGAQLDALVRLGVPLAQGYLLGRPDTAGWPVPDAGAVSRIAAGQDRRNDATVGSLLQPVATAPDAGPLPEGTAVLVDAERRPTGLAIGGRRRPGWSTVRPGELIRSVARRCVARRPEVRWDPMVCLDGDGRPRGVIRVEALVEALVDGQGQAGAAATHGDGTEVLRLW